jgi:TRAP-type mannitol/chloroaromatic compound transport system substrate-binding protein
MLVMSLQTLADDVKAASGGRFIIKTYSGDAVAPAGKEFDAAESGLLDIGVETGSWLKDRWPYADLFTYRSASMTAMEMLLWNEVGGGLELAREMVQDSNVYVFNGLPMTPEIFLSSTDPINSPADLKGMRIRTAGGGIDGVAFEEAGASVVSVAGGEVYESIQRGVINAFQYSSPSMDYSNAFYEIVNYVYMSPVRQPTDYHYYYVNRDSYDELPADLQALLQLALRRHGMQFFMNQAQEDTVALAFYKDYGVTVEPMATSVEDLLRDVAAGVYADLAAEYPFAKKVIESQDAFYAKIREAFPSGL